MPAKDREQLHVEAAEQWRSWLALNADRGAGVWVVTWKTATGQPRPTYDKLVLEALAQGWVDSTAGTVDDDRSMLWFAPRKRGSGWSRPNKLRIAVLEAAGRMQPRGAAVLAAAKTDGSWTMLDEVENLVVPPDLALALDEADARTIWDAFPRSVKRVHLVQLVQAKRPATRAGRIAQICEAAVRGERASYP